MNNLKFFDFEVYPKYWCCVVSDEEDTYPGGAYNNKFNKEIEDNIKSKMRVYTSDDPQAALKLKEDLSTGVVCGYNIKRYDLIIAKCLFSGFSPEKLRIANDLLINPESVNYTPEAARIESYIKFGWNGAEAWQDLLDDSVKSLKDKECSLGMDIRETTVPFDKEDLTEQDKADIIYYCKHDVYALHVLYVTTSKPYVDTKIQLCDTFGLERKVGYKNTNAKLCCKVLGAERVHGTTVSDPTITIRDEKLKNYFETWLPPEIYNHLLTKQENKEFNICDNTVSIGDGGLHSVYNVPVIDRVTPGLYVESTDDWTIYNVDVSSCYPSVMMFCQAMSRAIKKPDRFHYIYKRRVDLKMTPKAQWTPEDKAFVLAAKLILNTTYGAMGNKYLNLYDDYMRTKVCRVGQMILISIMCHMYKTIPGLRVIQTNTDGVLVYVRRSDYDKIMAIVNEFSEISNFLFEVEEDNKLWQLNVNNYIAVHLDGKVKNKGGAFIMSVYQKGTNRLCPLGNFCVQRAQMDFLINGTNPVKHLLDNTSVSDFCVTCTNTSYKTMVQYMSNGSVVQLGKVGRCIAVENPEFGLVKKQKTYKGEFREATVALCPPHPLMVNDNLDNYKIENGYLIHIPENKKYKIDYAYYARELDKALDIPWMELKNESIGLTKKFNL